MHIYASNFQWASSDIVFEMRMNPDMILVFSSTKMSKISGFIVNKTLLIRKSLLSMKPEFRHLLQKTRIGFHRQEIITYKKKLLVDEPRI